MSNAVKEIGAAASKNGHRDNGTAFALTKVILCIMEVGHLSKSRQRDFSILHNLPKNKTTDLTTYKLKKKN